jgi:Sec-independent protein translocase protein TatA
VGFGSEILLLLVLSLLMLGPKRMPAIIKNVARAKAQFESATRNFKSQLNTEFQSQNGEREPNSSQEVGRQ